MSVKNIDDFPSLVVVISDDHVCRVRRPVHAVLCRKADSLRRDDAVRQHVMDPRVRSPMSVEDVQSAIFFVVVVKKNLGIGAEFVLQNIKGDLAFTVVQGARDMRILRLSAHRPPDREFGADVLGSVGGVAT